MPSARWHDSHFDWKIGATSLVNVTVFVGSAARATPATKRVAPTVKAHRPSQLVGLPYIVALLSELARSGQSNLARSLRSNLACSGLVRRSNCARLGAYRQVSVCNASMFFTSR